MSASEFRSNHKNKRLNCEFCDKIFFDKANFRTH